MALQHQKRQVNTPVAIEKTILNPLRTVEIIKLEFRRENRKYEVYAYESMKTQKALYFAKNIIDCSGATSKIFLEKNGQAYWLKSGDFKRLYKRYYTNTSERILKHSMS